MCYRRFFAGFLTFIEVYVSLVVSGGDGVLVKRLLFVDTLAISWLGAGDGVGTACLPMSYSNALKMCQWA